MAGVGGKDKYANIIYDEVTESAANTLTFESIDVGLNLFDKIGLKISRVEYTDFRILLAAGTDRIELVREFFYMATIGDSLMWGNGLRDEDKFPTLVANEI